MSITGEAYFALTPSFIMAGARLSAVFRSGNFSAWFIAYADFLIGWAPLQYQAEMGVRIGAAFVLHIFDIAWTLSFEISAMLRIWGPPFAGEAYVDLGIVAFTVPLGDRSASREPLRLDWAAFKTQFLPEKPLRITITSGMVEERNDFILVNPSELCLSVELFVPISKGLKGWQQSAVAPKLGIRPMGEKQLELVTEPGMDAKARLGAGVSLSQHYQEPAGGAVEPGPRSGCQDCSRTQSRGDAEGADGG